MKQFRNQSSSEQKTVKKAVFVQIDEQKEENYKYKFVHLKNKLNLFIVKFNQWIKKKKCSVNLYLTEKIKLKKLQYDLFVWSGEVMIEGTLANSVTFIFFGFEFSIINSFVHGIAIYLGIDIVKRLRDPHGSTKKLLDEYRGRRRK